MDLGAGLANHEEPTRQGWCRRQSAPYQRMQTKDGYLMVGAASSVMPIGVGSFDYSPTNCLE
jgi:hypothetical protein